MEPAPGRGSLSPTDVRRIVRTLQESPDSKQGDAGSIAAIAGILTGAPSPCRARRQQLGLVEDSWRLDSPDVGDGVPYQSPFRRKGAGNDAVGSTFASEQDADRRGAGGAVPSIGLPPTSLSVPAAAAGPSTGSALDMDIDDLIDDIFRTDTPRQPRPRSVAGGTQATLPQPVQEEQHDGDSGAEEEEEEEEAPRRGAAAGALAAEALRCQPRAIDSCPLDLRVLDVDKVGELLQASVQNALQVLRSRAAEAEGKAQRAEERCRQAEAHAREVEDTLRLEREGRCATLEEHWRDKGEELLATLRRAEEEMQARERKVAEAEEAFASRETQLEAREEAAEQQRLQLEAGQRQLRQKCRKLQAAKAALEAEAANHRPAAAALDALPEGCSSPDFGTWGGGAALYMHVAWAVLFLGLFLLR